MSRLLVITQKVDQADDLLGFFVSWLRQFAGHFDRIDVITLGAGSFELPPNVHVHSLGKERGVGKFRQWLRCLRLLWRYTPTKGSMFCHMSPIFAIVAWPFAVLRRARLSLWYLHRSRTLKLRLAVMLSDVVVTADAASLNIKNRKIISVGHGIDISRFATARDWSVLDQRPLRILSVGRLSPIKDFATLIRAVARLREREVPVQLRIVGKAVMAGDHAYERELHELARKLSVTDAVHFVGFVPYRDIVEQYAWADVVVGCTPRGGIDKVLLEGMAAGCPTFTSNTVMRRYLEPFADGLIFSHRNWEDLADKLEGLSDKPAVSAAMVASVREHHDLKSTIGKISALL